MPVGPSGSYYYPVAQSPNSSYPTVDMRGLPTAPPAAAGLGRLFVLSGTDDLYYKDPSGNVVAVAAATGSAVYDTIDANLVYNSRGNLILSSAIGSTIWVSGGLGVAGGATFFGGANFPNSITLTAGGSIIYNTNGHLILSSTQGTVYISGTLSNGSQGVTTAGNILCGAAVNLNNSITPMVNGSATNLILTSSNSSRIVVSGSLKLGAVFTAATLPTGLDVVSGSIAYISDKKCFAMYTPEGWMRVLTGTL